MIDAKPEAAQRSDPSRSLQMSSGVVLANDVNQSIFRPSWLLKNGIVTEDEVDEEPIFSPGLTRVRTSAFELLVLPDRLQMQFPPECEDASSLLQRVLAGIARLLPHTPFSAVGLNFQHAFVPIDAEHFAEWNRERFACPWAIAHTPKTSRTRYGCNFAYDSHGARFRVRIAVHAAPNSGGDQAPVEGTTVPYVVNLHCNLHRALHPEQVASELPRVLGLWRVVRDETAELVDGLLK